MIALKFVFGGIMSNKTNTLNKSKPICVSMGYKEFEEQELDRFFKDFYTYDNAVLMLDDLTEEQFPDLVDKTRKSIRAGIEDFLETQEQKDTLYHADLHAFVCRNPVKTRIEQELENSGFGNVNVYADDVSQSYSMFVYNESAERFMEVFGESPVD